VAAQSTAKAPLLDAGLKRFIGVMTPLTVRQLGSLDDRVVVVTFFASWCPPCRPEFGHLNDVRQAFAKKDVTFLAINLFEDFFKKGKQRRMMRFLDATKPSFAVLRAKDDSQIEKRFGGVDRIPTVFVFDRMGNPVFTFIHQVDAKKTHATAKELTAVLRAALR
jgi:cytochrome c biogenesis protein CcmG/thiol:disulfide interchange protein DsbE